MNIKLSYLYRDAGNFKQHNEIVFSNNQNIPLATIQEKINSQLIEGLYFNATQWNLPDLHFEEWNDALDHHWHELESIIQTEDIQESMLDIIKLL